MINASKELVTHLFGICNDLGFQWGPPFSRSKCVFVRRDFGIVFLWNLEGHGQADGAHGKLYFEDLNMQLGGFFTSRPAPPSGGRRIWAHRAHPANWNDTKERHYYMGPPVYIFLFGFLYISDRVWLKSYVQQYVIIVLYALACLQVYREIESHPSWSCSFIVIGLGHTS